MGLYGGKLILQKLFGAKSFQLSFSKWLTGHFTFSFRRSSYVLHIPHYGD